MGAGAVGSSSPSEPGQVDRLTSSPAWTWDPDLPGAGFGNTVSTAGDVNGDGYSDVIVGASTYSNGQLAEGCAFVFLGSASGLATTPSWTVESNQDRAEFGTSVSTAGDVNGDGYSDVIVGAASYDNGEANEGRAFVYLGSAAGLAASAAWTAEPDQATSYFGMSVATAGDVNGDGYSDVIVGAPIYGNYEGRAYVYLGSPAGLAASPSWIARSNQPGCWFGFSVATAGDVNSDGYADVIVGADNFSNGQTAEGRAFVYLGAAAGLATSASWTAESNVINAHFGRAVATAGDVDGDGFGDVIIGASQYGNGQSLEGAAYVYRGSAAGLGASYAWIAESNQIGAHFGQSVATAGDVNGDGLADVIVGANEFDNGQDAEGRAFVYLSRSGGLSSYPAWTAESDQATSWFGTSVATAGDVNGDGYSDVIVGAPNYDNGETNEGQAFVYNGGGGTLDATDFWQIGNGLAGDYLGSAVASGGDINGDGYSDFILGAPGYDGGQTDEGRIAVYYGERDDTSIPYYFESNQDGALFGTSLAPAGDVNGDGYSDIIIGAPSYTNGQTSEGRAFVYLGSSGGLLAVPWTAESNQAQARFGWSVAGAGDVNGDGYSDVIIGAYEYANGEDNEGRAYVYLGSPTGLGPSPAWTAESNQVVAGFGNSVASAGDVNGDGYSDVIVGAPLYDNGQSNEGRAFLYLGSPAGLAAAPAWTAESNQVIADFGVSVAGVGDVNGDGYSDVIVGADGFDNGQNDEGRAFVYLGSAGGLATTPAWTAESDQIGAQFGYSVAGAGDVNNDGFSDVVIGAPYYDRILTDEGGAFAYHGSAAGLAAAPAWTAYSDQAFASLGFSVATAGDVTGDGFSDVAVGIPYFDGAQTDCGKVNIPMGNGSYGRDRTARQARSDNSAPIDILGLAHHQNAFLLKALGRTAAGRGDVWFEWEVKRLGVPFDGQGRGRTQVLNTGPPVVNAGSSVPLSEAVLGLQNDTAYRWRLRMVSDSPFFPRTPWFTMPGNGLTETDLRTSGTSTGIDEEGAPVAQPLLLEPIHPNPFAAPYEIGYSLATAGPVRLVIYDVQGRARAVLAAGVEAPGRHVARWDALARSGGSLEAGVYFVRLTAGDRVETRKLILAP